MRDKRMYRVVLAFPNGRKHSVFVKARSRNRAEKYALSKYPAALRVDRSPHPLS